MTDETAGELGYEDHRRPGRRNLAGAEPADSSLCGRPADLGRRLEVARIPGGRVVVIAMHIAAGVAQHRTADPVAGLGVTAGKPMTIAVGPGAPIRPDGSTFRIRNAFVV